MKRSLRLLSLVLALCMVVPTFIGAASREDISETQTHDEQPTFTPETKEELKLPDIVSREEAELGGFVKRLKENETDLNTLIFKNGDGTNTMKVYSHPVKYVDEFGKIQDISLEVKASDDGSFVSASHSVTTKFEKKLSDGITLSHEDVNVKLVPKYRALSLASASVSDEKKQVSYPLDEKTSYVYELTYLGFKEDIVVKEYTGQTEYNFTIYTNGLTLVCENGSYYLADDKGDIKATIGDIIVFTADERNNTFGKMTHETVRAGQEYNMTIHLDADYLKDENTLYPIRIDPTIEIVSGGTAGAIEDATLNSNAGSGGTSGSILVGVRGSYGISRVLMRFPTLSLDGIDASYIVSAQVSIRDLMCQSRENFAVECRIYDKSAPAWTETSPPTFAAASPYVGALLDSHIVTYNGGVSGGNWYSFDLTSAAVDWANGTQDPAKGIIFKASDTHENQTTNLWYKTFSSYNRSSYKPSLKIVYNAEIFISSYLSIPEGEEWTLDFITNAPSVTWASNNEDVATVDQNGTVTGIRAGTATVTATITGTDGTTDTRECTVYVYLANGVYYIQNMHSNYYLHVKHGGISNLTDVYQYSKYADSVDNNYKIRQMWKTHYLGEGRYTIRPMNKLDLGLDVTDGRVDIYDIGTSNILSSVPSYGEWTIEWCSTGYVFKNNGDSSLTMQAEDTTTSSGGAIIASTYSEGINCRWELTKVSYPPSGAYWFDTNAKRIVTGIVDTKYIIYGSTYDIDDLGLVAIAYSPTSNYQTFTWSSSDTAIATINSSTGAIVGKNSGETKITAKRYINGSYHTLSFDLIVIGADQYSAGVRIANVNGKQYYDFTIPVNELFEDAVALCEDHRCMNWTQYCTWAYDISIFYQPSLSEHKGMQLGSFLWFYQQVNHGAVWDIKRETQWKAALPGLPYLRDEDGEFGDFVFRGAVTTAEGLGNIMYGYTGRATGFGEVTLYWGGGVAAQGSVNSDAVTQPPYYGDTKEDHDNIKLGFDMFNEDYPNYPDVGYDGIPLDGWLAAIADVILNPGT